MGAQGIAILDFGPFPGSSDAFVDVVGQSGIAANSLVEAWIFPADTEDHTADEHLVETIVVRAGNIVPGTGFRIYGMNSNQLHETASLNDPDVDRDVSTVAGQPGHVRSVGRRGFGGYGTLIYGKWCVAWAWN